MSDGQQATKNLTEEQRIERIKAGAKKKASPKKKKKMSSVYANKRGTFPVKVWVKMNEEYGVWEARTSQEKADDAEGYEEHTIEFARPSWALGSWLEEISTSFNELGLKLNDQTRIAENTLKYLMKKNDMFELRFDRDSRGFQHISDKCWDEMTGDDGLAPTILAAIYRAYTEISEV